jgi:hypothetical protein
MPPQTTTARQRGQKGGRGDPGERRAALQNLKEGHRSTLPAIHSKASRGIYHRGELQQFEQVRQAIGTGRKTG